MAEIGLGPLGLAVAFAAGLVSFTSPCVLPLVPGYLSFVSGVGFDELGARPRRVASTTTAFVAGFSAMFIALGVGAAWFGSGLQEHQRTLQIVGGAFLIAAAVVYAGIPLPRILTAERRLHIDRGGTSGYLTAGATGLVFALGWTPCLGPTLGAILSLSFLGSPGQAAVLLGVYSLGLGIPFLLFGLAFTKALGFAGWLRRHWRIVSYGSATLLVALGVLLITGDFVRILNQLARYTGWQI